jgi:hypothetical protein
MIATKFRNGLFILIIAILFYSGFLIVNATIRAHEKLISFSSSEQILGDSIPSNTELDSLTRLLAFREAQLALSKNDSIQLILDLAGGSAKLSIHSVNILESEIRILNEEPLLQTLSSDQYYALFSEPIKIVSVNCTVIKEPIVEIEAPKNAEEAAAKVSLPDTLLQSPSFLRIDLENGISIFLNQSEMETENDELVKDQFVKDFHRNRLKEFFRCLLTFDTFEYHPKITFELPRSDINAIYRALPNQALVVLRP